MAPASFRPLLTLSLLLACCGCGRVKEISACRALAHEVNPTLDQIEALSKKPSHESHAQMAKLYAELAKRLRAQASGKSALATAIRDYAGALDATAGALRNLSEAGRTGVSARANEPRRELERQVKRERAAVIRIDAECHG
jgi:hypothetical protein